MDGTILSCLIDDVLVDALAVRMPLLLLRACGSALHGTFGCQPSLLLGLWHLFIRSYGAAGLMQAQGTCCNSLHCKTLKSFFTQEARSQAGDLLPTDSSSVWTSRSHNDEVFIHLLPKLIVLFDAL